MPKKLVTMDKVSRLKRDEASTGSDQDEIIQSRFYDLIVKENMREVLPTVVKDMAIHR